MTVLRLFFCILILHVTAMINAQDDQSGFISLDCGSRTNYKQEDSGINYVSDDGFIEGGVSYNLSHIHSWRLRVFNSIRSFPENIRNCYTFGPQKGKNNKYLIRALFYYAGSRGQPPQFDLHIGADYWATVYIPDPTRYITLEMIHVTSSDYIYVCLVNTGQGDPFITSLELRLLDNTMYKEQYPQSLFLVKRSNFGTNEIVRYPDDKYDRIWYQNICCRAVQASERGSLGPNNDEQVPSKVMSTAITPINSTQILLFRWHATTDDEYIIYIHLAEVETLKTNQRREFNLSINGTWVGTISPTTNITTIRKQISGVSRSTYVLSLISTLNSTLPPILNAVEVYTLKQLLQNQTDDQDAAAIWSTKSIYGLKNLNWQGDPCIPQEYVWVGLKCNYSALGAARITSLNLSSRGLSGEIAPALANLTMIQSLDLSYNYLTGNVPKFLAQLDNLRVLNLTGNNFTRPLPAELVEKSKKGLLLLSTDESSGEESSNDKAKIGVITAIIIGCIVALSLVVFLGVQLKKKALIKWEEGITLRKQQYTYSEVLSITNNFQNEIGRGGFGRVFHGTVGDKQVAVKMLSESSSQGYKEFQSEVKILMEIHHTNITSLIGYCNENNHKAIIYDYMANGNLGEHLFDECPNVLSWERRLQIGCDAAEGLAYMHHGCRPPIVHRDVKASNILLNESFEAKLSDFGLSRVFPTEDATHVSSVKVVGTIGYLDPKCHSTYTLTEKSDIYSFGVVLMELITSRHAIAEDIHIIRWVTSAVEEGNIEHIIDSRLEGRFDINTAWKVIEIAIACVSPISIKRPTMNYVVMELKQCLQAENTSAKPISLNMDSVSDLYPR